MTNKKTTRRALLTSVISLILCCSMLVGTTFAWFTDEVTSGNNIIKSGTLDVEMTWSETANGEYKDASEGAIFDYQYWEPGYTEVRYVKIENVGNLAFKYRLNIVPNLTPAEGEVNLADVIEVYMLPAAEAANKTREEILETTPVGTLSELMADADGAAYGVMLPTNGSADVTLKEEDAAIASTGSVEYCIVLHMQEEAGNEYQNLSVGEGFSVTLLATQYTWENDSFDNTYDKTAEYEGLPVATVTKAPEYIGVAGLDWNAQSPVNDENVTLDTAYVFKTTETYEQAQENTYRYWHADFVVTFDRAVTAADGVGIAGNYGSYQWIGFDLNEEMLKLVGDSNGVLAANTPVRLLSTAGISMNYEELCLLVQEFICGAWADSNETDLTMTVELRLYETTGDPNTESGSKNEETGNYAVIGTYAYTFLKKEAAPAPSDLPVANVKDADEYENVTIDWNSQFGIAPPEGTQLESVYVFSAQDDYDAAQESPYADWTCDYYVTLDRDLEENQLILGGNYGSYGWIGFVAPGGIAKNTATPLLQTANMTLTYENVVLMVQEFTCGVADVDNALSGATITVELRVTNPADTSEYYVINSTSYTFN